MSTVKLENYKDVPPECQVGPKDEVRGTDFSDEDFTVANDTT